MLRGSLRPYEPVPSFSATSYSEQWLTYRLPYCNATTRWTISAGLAPVTVCYLLWFSPSVKSVGVRRPSNCHSGCAARSLRSHTLCVGIRHERSPNRAVTRSPPPCADAKRPASRPPRCAGTESARSVGPPCERASTGTTHSGVPGPRVGSTSVGRRSVGRRSCWSCPEAVGRRLTVAAHDPGDVLAPTPRKLTASRQRRHRTVRTQAREPPQQGARTRSELPLRPHCHAEHTEHTRAHKSTQEHTRALRAFTRSKAIASPAYTAAWARADAALSDGCACPRETPTAYDDGRGATSDSTCPWCNSIRRQPSPPLLGPGQAPRESEGLRCMLRHAGPLLPHRSNPYVSGTGSAVLRRHAG